MLILVYGIHFFKYSEKVNNNIRKIIEFRVKLALDNNMNTRSVQRTLLASAGLKALPVGVLTDIQGNTIIVRQILIYISYRYESWNRISGTSP